MRLKSVILILSFATAAAAGTAQAESTDIAALNQDLAELKQMVLSLQKTVTAQQSEISRLRAEKPQMVAAPQAAQDSLAASGAGSSAASSGKQSSYLPEVGALADVVAFSSKSKEDGEGNDRVSARDFELILGHDVDPYSRLDATIVFSDEEEPELEEAYASIWDLPLDTRLRFGKMKQKIGKAASVHRDSLDTVDVPLVVQRYLGAEGFSKSGADISGYLPSFNDAFTQEVVFGVMDGGNGEEGQLFGESRRIPSLYARLRNSLDFSDDTNLDLGATWLNGSVDNDSAREANAVAFDLTLTHFVSPVNKFKLQGEAFLADRDLPELGEDESELVYSEKDRPWGYYVLADYRLSQRWGLGARWDWVEPIAAESEFVREDETALSGYLTFYQSEFARWRLQYQRAQLIDDAEDDRVFLQGTFAIGTHKHALQ